MKNFTLQDPRTFDNLDVNTLKDVFTLYKKGNKQEFLTQYFELSNTQKFYVVSALICSINLDEHLQEVRRILMNELEPDLRTLKLLNKPNPDTFENYNGYYNTKSCKNVVDSIDVSCSLFKKLNNE